MSRAPMTAEQRAKIAATMRGHAVTDEALAKMRRPRTYSPESRAALAQKTTARNIARAEARLADAGANGYAACIERARALCADGLSLAEIAAEIGMTKGQVGGMAMRYGFVKGVPKAVPRPKTPLHRAIKIAVANSRGRIAADTRCSTDIEPDLYIKIPRAPVRPVAFRADTGEGCRHITDPTRGAVRFCDAPRALGRAYCVEHHARCYVPARGMSVPA